MTCAAERTVKPQAVHEGRSSAEEFDCFLGGIHFRATSVFLLKQRKQVWADRVRSDNTLQPCHLFPGSQKIRNVEGMRGGGENKGPEATDTGLPLALFGGAQTCQVW